VFQALVHEHLIYRAVFERPRIYIQVPHYIDLWSVKIGIYVDITVQRLPSGTKIDLH